jgi:diacylglycerol kinase family enzyme
VSDAKRIPAFVNPESGTAEGARDALSAAGLFDIREIDPATIEDEVRKAVTAGAKRVLVSGGDGSIRAGATAVAGTDAELAVLPAGTLNHFARDHGIPTDLDEAAKVAGGSVVVAADAGYVGDKLFLNTSSIGAYVAFMRVRERLEPKLGYRIASMFALVRTFFYMRTATVVLEIEGERRTYSTQLVFIGVGERELQMPTLGNRKPGGKRGLHVIIVSGRAKTRLLALAFEAVTRGVKSAATTPELDSFIVDNCEITMHRGSATVALDGEAESLPMPLKYRLARDIIRITTTQQ